MAHLAATYQAVDQKKEDFRKYLERNGIIDSLTKVLVGLYEEPEKPDSPIDYIKQFLGGPSDVDTEALRHENEELKRKVEELQSKIDELTAAPMTTDQPMVSADPSQQQSTA